MMGLPHLAALKPLCARVGAVDHMKRI